MADIASVRLFSVVDTLVFLEAGLAAEHFAAAEVVAKKK